jgi:hypothetical protein
MDPRFTPSPEFDSEDEVLFDYSKLLTRESNAGPAGKPPAHGAKATVRATTSATSGSPADRALPPRKPAA